VAIKGLISTNKTRSDDELLMCVVNMVLAGCAVTSWLCWPVCCRKTKFGWNSSWVTQWME